MAQRLDKVLLDRGLADSRTQAQKLVLAGCVQMHSHGSWLTLNKPSVKISEDAELKVSLGEEQRYVSRAGLKLESAIKLCKLELDQMLALDIGQSTGGFTDCLLQHGVTAVVGVDVGHDQLAAKLKADGRVTCIEGINARELSADQLPCIGFDLAVVDVSFISQTLVLPRLPQLLKSDAYLISLVKPQFELQPENIGKGGLVKNKEDYLLVEAKIRAAAEALGFDLIHYLPSPIKGGDGNTEFLMVAKLNKS